MRSMLVLALIGIALAPSALASQGLFIVADAPDATLLTWEPVPDAAYYTIYRGPSPDHLVAIGQADVPLFVDESPAATLPHYAITAWVDGVETSILTTSSSPGGRPACVQLFDGLKFRVNVQNCLAH